jgi:hypothetical protein
VFLVRGASKGSRDAEIRESDISFDYGKSTLNAGALCFGSLSVSSWGRDGTVRQPVTSGPGEVFVDTVLLPLCRRCIQEDGLAAVAIAREPLGETLAAGRALPVTLFLSGRSQILQTRNAKLHR